MSTDQIPAIEPYWFGRPAAEVHAAVDSRTEQWAVVPGCTRYEWSDKGRVRIGYVDGYTGTRVTGGHIMKTGVNNSGYAKVNVVRDDGKAATVLVHQMVLLAHHPGFLGLAAFPPGLETRHNPSTGPLFNAYPEGLWPGTKLQNEHDKIRPVKEPKPPTPCINHDRCGGYVTRGGRRCHGCVVQVGRDGAQLLWAGASLQDAAKQLSYGSETGLHTLAVKYGGYGRPPLRLRVTVTLRRLLWWSGPAITGSDSDAA